MISFIVSVLNRMGTLNACLASLTVQDGGPGELVVCCNAVEPHLIDCCVRISDRYDARLLTTGLVGALSGYDSANMAAPACSGEWLCFPSDDSLYVFEFSRIMIETAARTGADLVYCNCLYRQDSDKGQWPAYTVLESSPRMGRIDKTNFLVRRSLFQGFPPHPRDWRDGQFIQDLVKSGVKHAKAPGCLVIHQ